MNIIHHGEFVKGVPDNPEHCNNLGGWCSRPCNDQKQLALAKDKRCEYHRPISVKSHTTYLTKAYLGFYKGLGGHKEHVTLSREELLKKERKCVERRSNWAGISKEIVVKHLDKLIKEI